MTKTKAEEWEEEVKQGIRDKFDKFIEKWCGKSFPHLVDSDENDGEEFRLELDKLITKVRADMKEECKKVAEELADVHKNTWGKEGEEGTEMARIIAKEIEALK